jgi:hypothetical protein
MDIEIKKPRTKTGAFSIKPITPLERRICQ